MSYKGVINIKIYGGLYQKSWTALVFITLTLFLEGAPKFDV